MPITVPKFIVAECDNCSAFLEISIKCQKNYMNRLREAGWYVSEKTGQVLCDTCRENMLVGVKPTIEFGDKVGVETHGSVSELQDKSNQ